MRYEEALKLLIDSDPRSDWLAVPERLSKADVARTYVYLPDVALRIQRDTRRLIVQDPGSEWTGTMVAGAEWLTACTLHYGASCIDRLFLISTVSPFRDFAGRERVFISPCLPMAAAGTQTVGVLDYRVARVLDWGDRVDGYLERLGITVESMQTAADHLTRRRAAFEPHPDEVEPRTAAPSVPSAPAEDARKRGGLFGKRG